MMQSVAQCGRVLQSVATCRSVLQCVAVCYRLLQCVTECYSVLQHVAACLSHTSEHPYRPKCISQKKKSKKNIFPPPLS